MNTDSSEAAINSAMMQAREAFYLYSKLPLQQRAAFMKAIATELENSGDGLIRVAMQETNLPEARLKGEKGRTIFQLNSYADALLQGDWLEACIDTANPEKTPPKPDLRKMMVPLGPVVVFGSSNFPFAYSTAGGDTASALAAGCSVVVKAHPAHPQTSTMVAELIGLAAKKTKMPDGIFSHLYGASYEVGRLLVMHPYTKAVGFTGSFSGGKQLFDWANQRKEPIPVFAEMGSTNPVFLFPGKLNLDAVSLANSIAGSVTLGGGQFCTKPGILIGVESESFSLFTQTLTTTIEAITPSKMLHEGIAANYQTRLQNVLGQKNVSLLTKIKESPENRVGNAALAKVDAATFLVNEVLREEVFGPFALIVSCTNPEEMIAVIKILAGQLTGTIMATTEDLKNNESLLGLVQEKCGRIILNGVPTGVEVCLSMQHGGPYPASTDSRFTSVGADGIKRFVRPVSFQNWDPAFLPDALKNENPLLIWRTVNNIRSKDKL
jgi:NADP-dependent aldehyde dehydrogenase